MPRAWMIGFPLVALLLGLFVGGVVGPRLRMQRLQQERERAEREHLSALGKCLELSGWTLARAADGGVLVRAEVVAGRDGRLALDAHADQGNEEVLVPEVQTTRLLPTMVKAGEPATLERPLRRVRPGDPDAFILRISCRPPGPRGIFGVVEYSSGVQHEGTDGFGNVVRPLPPQGRSSGGLLRR
jgi:hypothetical protein